MTVPMRCWEQSNTQNAFAQEFGLQQMLEIQVTGMDGVSYKAISVLKSTSGLMWFGSTYPLYIKKSLQIITNIFYITSMMNIFCDATPIHSEQGFARWCDKNKNNAHYIQS